MGKLNASDQIKVLELVKVKLKSDNKNTRGICHNIGHSCKDLFNRYDCYCVPMFTMQNVREFCKKHKCKQPKQCADFWYWWDRNNVGIRIQVINWIIRELKKEL